MEGKVVTREEMFKGSAWAWGEVHSFKSLPSRRTHLTNGLKLQRMRYRLAQRFAYGHGPFGPTNPAQKFLLVESSYLLCRESFHTSLVK